MAPLAKSLSHGLEPQKGPGHPLCSKQVLDTSLGLLAEQQVTIAQTQLLGPTCGLGVDCGLAIAAAAGGAFSFVVPSCCKGGSGAEGMGDLVGIGSFSFWPLLLNGMPTIDPAFTTPHTGRSSRSLSSPKRFPTSSGLAVLEGT